MEDEIYLKEEEAKKSKHRFSTVALVFMMFLLIGGAVIAALTGGGSPGYLVKWNTSTSIEDSIMNETGNLVTTFGNFKITSATIRSIFFLDNTFGLSGDTEIAFQRSGTTITTIGVDDTDDLFEIAYADGLSGDPQLTVDINTVEVVNAKFSYGDHEQEAICDTTPNVDTTNVIKLSRFACSITNFDTGDANGQVLYVSCGRPPAIGNMEVVDSGSLGDMRLAGGADFVCAKDGDILTLLSINGDWWEVARAFQ